jgi:hypothetical protein
MFAGSNPARITAPPAKCARRRVVLVLRQIAKSPIERTYYLREADILVLIR